MLYLSLKIEMTMPIVNYVGIRLVEMKLIFMMDMLMQIAYIGYALIAIKISKTYFIGRYQILT